ncbi:hypothetical protein Pst134EA_009550 [Puccinia striiformis f. sp. tritici]|uniref:hypothetical protein n=1 Tax=Puccinia striiformis f. sp. tritici TaxID=168172 RepID=UPI0020077C67|nr:hypothetical protein Pst134EA_009550 [Puccinia striiformis f. sp. tritici]KAH9469027.1 hypothetical protein Pst134EA_009550 [Puccinia striiformis f. sp. tritici]
MIASQILLVTVWFVAFPSGLTATTEVLDLETEVNQAKKCCYSCRGRKTSEKWKMRNPPSKHHITPKSESNRRKQLPSKKALQTVENWDSNQDKVVSLHGYSKKLTELQAEIQQQFKWIREGEKTLLITPWACLGQRNCSTQ